MIRPSASDGSGDGSTTGRQAYRMWDLADETPMSDLRIREAYRGIGIGGQAVAWLTGYLFTPMANVTRIEATTRQDNLAVRAALRRNGYAKEAHYRDAWPEPDGNRARRRRRDRSKAPPPGPARRSR